MHLKDKQSILRKLLQPLLSFHIKVGGCICNVKYDRSSKKDTSLRCEQSYDQSALRKNILCFSCKLVSGKIYRVSREVKSCRSALDLQFIIVQVWLSFIHQVVIRLKTQLLKNKPGILGIVIQNVFKICKKHQQ